MFPFFPSLQPSTTYNFWFSVNDAYDDDTEVSAMESEHQEWMNRVALIGLDLTPIGKSSSEQMENMDTEDEDANDESDDTDNSDEDDDDMDDMNGRDNLPDPIDEAPGYVVDDEL
uniref:Anaphase-promoting complex subunit 15 n=1 Tax=Anopheles marajoara TaxID=58244 RepID=A0A2M4C427_9DIPT